MEGFGVGKHWKLTWDFDCRKQDVSWISLELAHVCIQAIVEIAAFPWNCVPYCKRKQNRNQWGSSVLLSCRRRALVQHSLSHWYSRWHQVGLQTASTRRRNHLFTFAAAPYVYASAPCRSALGVEMQTSTICHQHLCAAVFLFKHEGWSNTTAARFLVWARWFVRTQARWVFF